MANNDKKKKNGTGFAVEVSAISHPKGSTVVKNKDGTVTIKHPSKGKK